MTTLSTQDMVVYDLEGINDIFKQDTNKDGNEQFKIIVSRNGGKSALYFNTRMERDMLFDSLTDALDALHRPKTFFEKLTTLFQ